MKKDNNIIILGDQSLGGVYLLVIYLSKEIVIRFGNFKNRKKFKLKKGDYIYLGSAMGNTLATRLLRHSTKCSGIPSHSIRNDLVKELMKTKMISKDKGIRPKKLHWHIDYFLENKNVSISKVIILRTNKSLEKQIGQYLIKRLETSIISPGLGASDRPGNTHLLRVSEVKWLYYKNYQIFEEML